MRLSIIIVNWEIFCWPAGDRLAHAHLSHFHVVLPSWFALSRFATFCLLLVPSHPPLVSSKDLCSGKFSLRSWFFTERSVWQGEVTHRRLPWLPPLFAFCQQSLACCPHCSQLTSTLHFNIAFRQVNVHYPHDEKDYFCVDKRLFLFFPFYIPLSFLSAFLQFPISAVLLLQSFVVLDVCGSQALCIPFWRAVTVGVWSCGYIYANLIPWTSGHKREVASHSQQQVVTSA